MYKVSKPNPSQADDDITSTLLVNRYRATPNLPLQLTTQLDVPIPPSSHSYAKQLKVLHNSHTYVRSPWTSSRGRGHSPSRGRDNTVLLSDYFALKSALIHSTPQSKNEEDLLRRPTRNKLDPCHLSHSTHGTIHGCGTLLQWSKGCGHLVIIPGRCCLLGNGLRHALLVEVSVWLAVIWRYWMDGLGVHLLGCEVGLFCGVGHFGFLVRIFAFYSLDSLLLTHFTKGSSDVDVSERISRRKPWITFLFTA